MALLVLYAGPGYWFDTMPKSGMDPRLLVLKFLPLILITFGITLANYFNSGRLAIMGVFVTLIYCYSMVSYLVPIYKLSDVFGPAFNNAMITFPVLIPLVFLAIHMAGDFNLFSPGGVIRFWVILGIVLMIPLVFIFTDSYVYKIFENLPVLETPLEGIRFPATSIALSLIVLLIMTYFREKNFYSNYISLIFWVMVSCVVSFELDAVWSELKWYPTESPLHHAVMFTASAIVFDLKVINLAYSKAYRDQLTQIFGRMALDERLDRLSGTYSICMIDIDHFKDFNDKYGHDAGDKVLKMVAELIDRNTTGEAYRFGGEEFTVVYPGRGKDSVADELSNLRETIADTKVKVTRKSKRATKLLEKKVTVSLGLAEHNDSYETPKEVLNAADNALFKAKEEGRNKLIVK